MKIYKHKIALLAFAIGLLIGIFAHRILTQKSSAELAQIEKCLEDLRTEKSVPKVEEKIAPPIVKLEDGTFPPPKYTDDMPEMFETKHPGEFKVTWTTVPGAKKYRVHIVNNKGESARTYTTSKHVSYVQRIPWDGSDNPYATYRVYVTSVNENGEEGPKGEVRKAKVYKDHAFFGTTEKVSPLEAPEIKSITTED